MVPHISGHAGFAKKQTVMCRCAEHPGCAMKQNVMLCRAVDVVVFMHAIAAAS